MHKIDISAGEVRMRGAAHKLRTQTNKDVESIATALYDNYTPHNIT
jgi:hypothetical protein